MYLGARLPERFLSPEGVEEHVPSLDYEVYQSDEEYVITYTVNGLFEYKVDNGSWQQDVDGSPITIGRALYDQTLHMRAVLGNLTHTTSVPIAAQASGSPGLRNIPSISEVGQDIVADTITIQWDDPTNLQPGDTYDLYWQSDALGSSGTISGVTSPYAHQRTGPGGHTWDLTSGGVVDDITYIVYVKDSGGVTMGQSDPLTVAADHV